MTSKQFLWTARRLSTGEVLGLGMAPEGVGSHRARRSLGPLQGVGGFGETLCANEARASAHAEAECPARRAVGSMAHATVRIWAPVLVPLFTQ